MHQDAQQVCSDVMRTTIRLDDDLLAAAKQRAAAERTTLGSLVEGALRRALDQRPVDPAERVTVRRFGGAQTLPGVDLDDSAALRDLMDGLR
jgi:Arc/MetJ family transcription regulator